MNHLLKMKKNPAEVIAKLKGEAEKATKGGKKDSRFWSPTFNKEKGMGEATVRLLPAMSDDALPWAQVYHRKFQGQGKRWYFENDLSTLGSNDDPVYDLTKRLYGTGIKSDEKVASEMKRKVKYVMNVQVIKDPAAPENNGKVFLWEPGFQVFEIINNARSPKFEGQVALDAFNPWTGAPFYIRMVGKQLGDDIVPNYEQSGFGSPCAMADTDDEIFAICAKGYDLSEFIAKDKFKTVDELRRILFEVLGPTVGSGVETVPGWGGNAAPAQRPARQEPAKPAAQSEQKPAETTQPAQSTDLFAGQDEELEGALNGGEAPSPQAAAEATPSDSFDDDMAFMENLMGG